MVCLQITLFSTGFVYAPGPNPPRSPSDECGRRRCERWNSWAFPVQRRRSGRWISSGAITIAGETAGHPHKFQANHGEARARAPEFIVKWPFSRLVKWLQPRTKSATAAIIARHAGCGGRWPRSCRAAAAPSRGANVTLRRN